MSTFKYHARDKFGKVIDSKIEADSLEAAGTKLRLMGFTPLNITAEHSGGMKFGGINITLGKKIKSSEIVMFSRQLSVLLDAGVPLIQSLESLTQQVENPVLNTAIKQMISDIRSGASFSTALEKHSLYFDILYRNIVKAGEASGNLDGALERLATMGEEEEEMRSRVRSATMYPVIVICSLGSAFILMVTFVLPRFAKIFSRFHTTLPLPTRALLGLNHLFTNYGLQVLIFSVVLIFLGFRFYKTTHGREIFDRLKLKTPIFGPLLVKIMLSRFCRITSGLIKSGIPIIQTMDLVSQTAGNVILSRSIEEVKIGINAGQAMNEVMRKDKIFPPMVAQMVTIGEETGKLDDLLIKVSDYFDYQINYTIKNLTTLLEPMLLLVLGGGVLFMALSIFLPMWNLIYLFKH